MKKYNIFLVDADNTILDFHASSEAALKSAFESFGKNGKKNTAKILQGLTIRFGKDWNGKKSPAKGFSKNVFRSGWNNSERKKFREKNSMQDISTTFQNIRFICQERKTFSES